MGMGKSGGAGRMKEDINKIKKKANTSPGTLKHIGEEGTDSIITSIEYDKDTYVSNLIKNIEDLNFKKDNSVKWLNVTGLKDTKIIEEIGRKFELHPLLLEDVLNTVHQPKFEDYDSFIFVIAKSLKYNEDKKKTAIEQISFVLLKDMLITFQEFKDDTFNNVIERIKGGSNIRNNEIDYLLYALLDAVVDKYYFVLEKLADNIDLLEDQLLENPDEMVLQNIYELKKEMIYVRNSIWPLRNIISNLTQIELGLIHEKTVYYLRDIHDHIVQMVDIIETYRDILSGMLDTYLSSIGNRTNEVMKVLTIFSTIFIPLTFLAGIYGMNFPNMPEIHWKYGYLSFWVISLIILVIMFRYFKNKKWI